MLNFRIDAEFMITRKVPEDDRETIDDLIGYIDSYLIERCSFGSVWCNIDWLNGMCSCIALMLIQAYHHVSYFCSGNAFQLNKYLREYSAYITTYIQREPPIFLMLATRC